jgi:hypothetical protein
VFVRKRVPGLRVSALNSTTPLPILLDADAERLAYETFARTGAASNYRDLLAHLYARWHEFNTTYFDGKLRPPHIGIGRTAPRRMSHCRATTNYGGALDITIAEGIAFGTNTRVIRVPWPAEGVNRFLNDLLIGETVKQYVMEVRGLTEAGYPHGD